MIRRAIYWKQAQLGLLEAIEEKCSQPKTGCPDVVTCGHVGKVSDG